MYEQITKNIYISCNFIDPVSDCYALAIKISHNGQKQDTDKIEQQGVGKECETRRNEERRQLFYFRHAA